MAAAATNEDFCARGCHAAKGRVGGARDSRTMDLPNEADHGLCNVNRTRCSILVLLVYMLQLSSVLYTRLR
jgi:hypothetical protein